MRILQTCGSQSWGGLEIQTLTISKALQDHGHKITLLCPAGSTLENKAKQLSLDVKPILSHRLSDIFSLFKVKKLLSHQSFDIIHSHHSHDLWTLVTALRLNKSKAKLILTKRMASGVNKKDVFHGFLYNRVNRILAISNFIRENVIKTCPVTPGRVQTLHNALDLSQFAPSNIKRQKVREELNIGEDELLVGMFGRLTPLKGHKEFLFAAKYIKDKTDLNVSFLIVGGASYGESAYESEIRRLVSELQLNNDTIFIGFEKDLSRLMSAVDILAFPSYSESFGNILLEAMAMQLPVVGSNSGAIPEIVVDGKTGYLVEPKNAEQLATKIITLLKDRSLRNGMGAAGRERVKKHFLFDDYIKSLEDYYSEIH